jgi:hypothetical protein
MRCRDFITVIGGAAALPITVHEQQIYRPRRIGILLGSYSATDPAGQVRIETLLKPRYASLNRARGRKSSQFADADT